MIDHDFRREVHRLVDESVPSTPWLEDRVMDSVRAAASGQKSTPEQRQLVGLRFATATLAVVVVALLVVVTLLGSRMSGPTSNASPAGPSRDAAIVAYRAMVDRDVAEIWRANLFSCATRSICTVQLMKTRTYAQALVADIASSPPPPSISAAAANVENAARHLVTELDAALDALQSAAVPVSTALNLVLPEELDLAVAILDCWPVTPLPTDTVAGYGCAEIAYGTH